MGVKNGVRFRLQNAGIFAFYEIHITINQYLKYSFDELTITKINPHFGLAITSA